MAITLNAVRLPSDSTGASPTDFTVTSTTGNLIIVAIISNVAATVSLVGDNKSNTYQSVGVTGTDSFAGNTYVFFAPSATTGVTTVTITHASTGVSIAVYDCSATDTVSKDTANALSSQTDNPNCTTSLVAAGAGICISVLSGSSGNPSAVSSPFTLDDMGDSAIGSFAAAAHNVNASSGTLTATFTVEDFHWCSVIAELKQAAGGVTAQQGRPDMFLGFMG